MNHTALLFKFLRHLHAIPRLLNCDTLTAQLERQRQKGCYFPIQNQGSSSSLAESRGLKNSLTSKVNVGGGFRLFPEKWRRKSNCWPSHTRSEVLSTGKYLSVWWSYKFWGVSSLENSWWFQENLEESPWWCTVTHLKCKAHCELNFKRCLYWNFSFIFHWM